MDMAQREVELTLRTAHGLSYGTTDDFTITNQASLLTALQGVSQTMQNFLGGIYPAFRAGALVSNERLAV